MRVSGLRWMVAALALAVVPLLLAADDDHKRFDFPPDGAAEDDSEARAEASPQSEAPQAPPETEKPAPAKAKSKPPAAKSKPKTKPAPVKTAPIAGTLDSPLAPSIQLPGAA